jgi:hypothetical protein
MIVPVPAEDPLPIWAGKAASAVKKIAGYVDFRNFRSSSRCAADAAGSHKETDDACDDLREGHGR